MKKIRNQLMYNYILIAVFALVLVGLVTWINYAYNEAERDLLSIDLDWLEEDYQEGGLVYAFDNQFFTEEDAIELVNEDLQVVESIGNGHENGHTYEQAELNEMLSLSEYETYITVYLNDMSGYFLLLKLTPYEVYNDVLLIMGIIAFLGFSIAVFLFSRRTAKQIVDPMAELEEGMISFGKGDLDHRISYEAGNELDQIKDTFNTMANQLIKERKRREAVENNRKELVRNISHDIKTPLTNILGYAKMVSDGDLKGMDPKEVNEVILTNSLAANDLVNDFFSLSKLESVDFELNRKKTDVMEYFRQLIIDFIPELEIRNVDYEIDLPDADVEVMIDPAQLRRVLQNLIHNGLKYNDEGLKFTFEAHVEDLTVSLIVEDNGIGIPEDMHASIFEPSVRVDASRRTDGSGLGLAIATKIIEAHEGSISLSTSENGGARFVIILPVCQ